MATTATMMARAVLTTTTTTQLYAAPSTGTAIVTNIALTNTTSSAQTATISFWGNSAAAFVPVLSGVTIPANSTVFFDLKQVLQYSTSANSGIVGYATNATAVDCHISGVVIV